MPGKHIIILGPPGSGKGTQAARIDGELGLKHISTGDLLREATSQKTDAGVKAEEFMKQGLLVPDEIILELISEELGALGDSGWILDGFPRTLAQTEALTRMLDENGQKIDHVFMIDVTADEIIERLASRRVCPACNAVYNLKTIETEVPGKCDKCGADLIKRHDDEEETVRRRIEVYEEQTAPVINYYRKHDELVTIKSAGGIDKITAEILSMMK
ncbi:MAG: adenylate kinase [Candidatus Krumholzibacteria bacterium]|nr:adenylate kinase [Candidatus Krumholzibacteria bacterium]